MWCWLRYINKNWILTLVDSSFFRFRSSKWSEMGLASKMKISLPSESQAFHYNFQNMYLTWQMRFYLEAIRGKWWSFWNFYTILSYTITKRRHLKKSHKNSQFGTLSQRYWIKNILKKIQSLLKGIITVIPQTPS